MKDSIKPILRRNPDTIVLHVGTNDVEDNKASKVMDDIDSLCQEIKEKNPGVEITLSELTTREDNPEAKKTVTEVNTLFENYCTHCKFQGVKITLLKVKNYSLERSN
jgi:lysophospholipase L1-like esterase